MSKERKPRPPVRRATKTEIEGRAARAMGERTKALQERDVMQQERNDMVRRLMQSEVIIGALVAREGRVRLTEQELLDVGADGSTLAIREMADGSLMLEMLAPEPEQSKGEAPSEGVRQLLKGGLHIVEHGEG